jgi:hypothetical protein
MQDKLKQLEDALILDANNKKYYEDFDFDTFKDSLAEFQPGSMPADGLYEYWVQTYKPNVIIEVGSFLGYSAIKMAKEVKRLGLPTKIICIDTWLGSPEHYKMFKSGEDQRIGYKNGYPILYEKFVTSVIENDVQDIICPFPYPSTVAFKILKDIFSKIDIQADFIFIDGSHEEFDVYMDLYNYYQLLGDGCFMWGDDWGWEGVQNDATKFANDNNLKLSVLSNQVHWNIQK